MNKIIYKNGRPYIDSCSAQSKVYYIGKMEFSIGFTTLVYYPSSLFIIVKKGKGIMSLKEFIKCIVYTTSQKNDKRKLLRIPSDVQGKLYHLDIDNKTGILTAVIPKNEVSKMKVKINDTDYFKGEDVPEPIELSIFDVEDNEMFGNIDLTFVETQKKLSLNKTNTLFLIDEFGDETDEWEHKKITLYNDKNIMYKGKRVGGLRLRMPVKPDVKT